MTPREFEVMQVGAVELEKRKWERTATLAHWVLSGLVKRPPKPDQLLGRGKDKGLTFDKLIDEPMSEDERKRAVMEKLERLRSQSH